MLVAALVRSIHFYLLTAASFSANLEKQRKSFAISSGAISKFIALRLNNNT